MEALKIWSGISKRLDNYFEYHGPEGINNNTYIYEKIENCEVCSKHVEIIKVEESDIWKNVLTRIIQKSNINSNKEFRIFHNNQYIYRVFKEKTDDTTLSKASEVDENKTIKELVDAGQIVIHKIYEVIPTDDVNDVRKIRLKRPQDFEEEEEE
jgi:hypothetical protein